MERDISSPWPNESASYGRLRALDRLLPTGKGPCTSGYMSVSAFFPLTRPSALSRRLWLDRCPIRRVSFCHLLLFGFSSDSLTLLVSSYSADTPYAVSALASGFKRSRRQETSTFDAFGLNRPTVFFSSSSPSPRAVFSIQVGPRFRFVFSSNHISLPTRISREKR